MSSDQVVITWAAAYFSYNKVGSFSIINNWDVDVLIRSNAQEISASKVTLIADSKYLWQSVARVVMQAIAFPEMASPIKP